MASVKEKVRGAVFASAIGDGFGYPCEFLRFEEILAKWPPNGPQNPSGTPIVVTDDTQMALSVSHALREGWSPDGSLDSLEPAFQKEFLIWLNDPENNRAPGMTCLKALEKLQEGNDWLEATHRNSKGCGANMRVLPAGLLRAKGESFERIGKVAQLQSAITHSHATALAASEITAIAIALLLDGIRPENLVAELRAHARSQMRIYHEDVLKSVWERPFFHSAEDFIEGGWQDVLYSLDRIEKGLGEYAPGTDPCLLTGEGWVAEESFATGLLCFLLSPNDLPGVLRRAVATGGDSDSISCLAGAFAGAWLGINAIPADWLERIEYRAELEELARFFT